MKQMAARWFYKYHPSIQGRLSMGKAFKSTRGCERQAGWRYLTIFTTTESLIISIRGPTISILVHEVPSEAIIYHLSSSSAILRRVLGGITGDVILGT